MSNRIQFSIGNTAGTRENAVAKLPNLLTVIQRSLHGKGYTAQEDRGKTYAGNRHIPIVLKRDGRPNITIEFVFAITDMEVTASTVTPHGFTEVTRELFNNPAKAQLESWVRGMLSLTLSSVEKKPKKEEVVV